jgi:hypothetical protein
MNVRKQFRRLIDVLGMKTRGGQHQGQTRGGRLDAAVPLLYRRFLLAD